MGAGRRTETYLGTHPPSAGSSSSSSNSARFLNLPLGELASVIFGCSHATYEECVNQLIFGLPHPHFSYIKNIQPGMPLFLFRYSDRKLHGIFEADSCGELNINPYAWTDGSGEKTSYPAQVRVRVRRLCSPLPEKVFKEAIVANYSRDPQYQTHFFFELNHVQTDMLLSLFTRNTTSLSSTRVNSQAGPLSRPQGGDEEDWFKPKKTGRSTMNAWHNAAPFIPTPAQTAAAQSEGRAATPEHWENGCEDKADETTADNGGSDSENVLKRSLEPMAEESLDWRSDVLSSNVKLSEGDEDQRKLEVIEKLRQLKQKGKMQSNLEVKAEIPQVQDKSQGEASGSGSIESTKVQDSALVEWEKLARERCLQEQTMLREEREQLREKLQTLDVSVAKTISKNLELSASAIAQMRQDEIKLRHIMEEAFNQAELLRELDQLKKKNATLEYTQVRMASELEGLKSDVVRMSEQLEALLRSSRQVSQAPEQSSTVVQNDRPVNETGTTVAHGNQESLQQVYLIGGYDGQSWLGSVDILYPATYEFTSVAPMLTPRSYAAASVLMGSIYVFGGGNGRSWYETVESYDLERDRWTPCPPMRLQRGSLAGATVGDRIFAIGGGNCQVYFSDVECYDAHLGMWISSTSMLSKRFGVAAAELNGALYAVGGYNDKKYMASVERFDPREALWTAVAPMRRRRGSFSAVALGGKIYAIGGYDGTEFLSAVEFYEPRTNHWVEMEMGMHIGRAYGAVARVGSDLYMFGGLNSDGYVDSVEYYTEHTGWEIVEDIVLGGRCFLACAVLE